VRYIRSPCWQQEGFVVSLALYPHGAATVIGVCQGEEKMLAILSRTGATLGAVCIGLAAWHVPGRADDAQLRDFLRKAATAIGGLQKIQQYPATISKGKGTFHGLGQPVAYTAEYIGVAAKRQRISFEGEVQGQKFSFVFVVDGDKGWIRVMDQVMEMTKDQLDNARAEMYADYVTSLRFVEDKDIEVSSLGDVKVDNKPAVGIRVAKKDHPDVNLFFDPASHLLLKAEYRVKNDMTGEEQKQEVFFSDYRNVQGLKIPFKTKILRDGKPWVDGEIVEVKLYEKLGDEHFAKP